MGFLAQTPQDEIQNVITQTGEGTKQAMVWFAVIAVIVLLILFSKK